MSTLLCSLKADCCPAGDFTRTFCLQCRWAYPQKLASSHQLHFFLGLFKWWQKHHDPHSLGRLGRGNAQLICSLVSHLTRIYLPVNYTFLNPTVIGSRFGQIKPRAIIFWGELWVKHALESHWLQTTFSQSVLSCLATLAALGGRVDKADTAPL